MGGGVDRRERLRLEYKLSEVILLRMITVAYDSHVPRHASAPEALESVANLQPIVAKVVELPRVRVTFPGAY